MSTRHPIVDVAASFLAGDQPAQLQLDDDAKKSLHRALSDYEKSDLIDAVYALLEFAYFLTTELNATVVADGLLEVIKRQTPRLHEIDAALSAMMNNPSSTVQSVLEARQKGLAKPKKGGFKLRS